MKTQNHPLARVRCGGDCTREDVRGLSEGKGRSSTALKEAESRLHPTNFREFQSVIEVRRESSTTTNIPHMHGNRAGVITRGGGAGGSKCTKGRTTDQMSSALKGDCCNCMHSFLAHWGAIRGFAPGLFSASRQDWNRPLLHKANATQMRAEICQELCLLP